MQILKIRKAIAKESKDKMQGSKKEKNIIKKLKEEKMNTGFKSKSGIQ